jgi:hypothetical protein
MRLRKLTCVVECEEVGPVTASSASEREVPTLSSHSALASGCLEAVVGWLSAGEKRFAPHMPDPMSRPKPAALSTRAVLDPRSARISPRTSRSFANGQASTVANRPPNGE